jgi:hypothetical protein
MGQWAPGALTSYRVTHQTFDGGTRRTAISGGRNPCVFTHVYSGYFPDEHII